jgi:hypothetical protein
VPSFKTIHKFYNQFNNDGSVLTRKRRRVINITARVEEVAGRNGGHIEQSIRRR